MIISQTPLRVSFFGGGTDLGEWYRRRGGAVLSTAIDKYCYITVNRRFDHTVRVSYSRTEIVEHSDEIQHPLVREALKITGIPTGVEITSIADIPGGTGMGSSSTFTVGLLSALWAFKGRHVSSEELARTACEIEIDRVGEPIGKQDQYAAAYGGINVITFNPDDTVFVDPVILRPEVRREFQASLLLFYTGLTRPAGQILAEQKARTVEKSAALQRMGDMVAEGRQILLEGKHLGRLGALLHEGWELKRGLASKITNPEIDQAYEAALTHGALGGKLLGAGGGGFLLLYVERQNQSAVRLALSHLREIQLDFEPRGSRIIFVSE